MDRESVIEYLYEIKSKGKYAADVVDNLKEEIRESSEILDGDKNKLLNLMSHIESNDSSSHMGSNIDQVWKILLEYSGMKEQWAKLVADRLLGKR